MSDMDLIFVYGILYGPPGVGKTTLASMCGNAFILDMEHGSRFIRKGDRVKYIEDYETLKEYLQNFPRTKYDTCVVDSAGKLLSLATEYTLRVNKWANLNAKGFGECHAAVRKNVLEITDICKSLVHKHNRNVIIIGHSTLRESKDTTMESHDRLELDYDKHLLNGLVSDTDFCFFMNHQKRVENERATSCGSREIFTTDMGGAMAKKRFLYLEKKIELFDMDDKAELESAYSEFWNKVRGG